MGVVKCSRGLGGKRDNVLHDSKIMNVDEVNGFIFWLGRGQVWQRTRRTEEKICSTHEIGELDTLNGNING